MGEELLNILRALRQSHNARAGCSEQVSAYGCSETKSEEPLRPDDINTNSLKLNGFTRFLNDVQNTTEIVLPLSVVR